MELIMALVLGMSHPAPKYIAPVQVIPVVVDPPSDDVLAMQEWGPACSR
jgi:hypothetical protein